MKIQLADHHREHLDKIGVDSAPAHIETTPEEYQRHTEEWKRTLPNATAEEIHTKVIGHLGWHRQAKKTEEEKAVAALTPKLLHRLRWELRALALLFLLLVLFSARAHAQFSKIETITIKNSSGTTIGTFASPFTLKAGASCSVSISGTTLTFNCSGGGGSSEFQVNGVDTSSQTLLNWQSGTCIAVSNPSVGNVGFAFTCQLANTLAAATHQFLTSYTASTGNFTQARPACADLSDATASCSTDATNATNITSGTLPDARLSNVVTASSCGDSTHSCGLTYDAHGRITAATNNAISSSGGGSFDVHFESASLGTGATRFIQFTNQSSTEADTQRVATKSLTLSNLQCHSTVALTTTSAVISVGHCTPTNGLCSGSYSGTLNCTISGSTVASCSDTNAGDNISLAAGDFYALKITTSGGATSTFYNCSIEAQ